MRVRQSHKPPEAHASANSFVRILLECSYCASFPQDEIPCPDFWEVDGWARRHVLLVRGHFCLPVFQMRSGSSQGQPSERQTEINGLRGAGKLERMGEERWFTACTLTMLLPFSPAKLSNRAANVRSGIGGMWVCNGPGIPTSCGKMTWIIEPEVGQPLGAGDSLPWPAKYMKIASSGFIWGLLWSSRNAWKIPARVAVLLRKLIIWLFGTRRWVCRNRSMSSASAAAPESSGTVT